MIPNVNAAPMDPHLSGIPYPCRSRLLNHALRHELFVKHTAEALAQASEDFLVDLADA